MSMFIILIFITSLFVISFFRAILCRESEARCLTKEHKPSDPEESRRIESLGGQDRPLIDLIRILF
jgi:hypothetical protein